ncbi:PREDICTED: proactivator polypeptide-like 1 [Miniopterus natalensis]|uniref:proactivator polypeptide-like 1 n=1 Tax=Miniopterus natalensis TaxID=291302 RepID=UPI0007A70BB8|nr:PREDICTED: proactivator polypeptide-like 1 [Miniopterus natalensis]
MLPALLLLPSLLGATLASPIQGPRECARGSAVWCRDLQAAARCGAVGHCRSAVWSKPTTRTLPCDVCLDVVAAAGNGLNPNTTDDDILALVTKTCEWLPSQDASAKCKEMTDAHSSAILGMLEGAPDSAPAEVCTALTLCQPLQRLPATPATPESLSQEDTSELVAPFMANGPLSFHLPQIPEDTVCQNCVQLVTRLHEEVGSNVSALADAITQEQCKSLGPGLALICKDYILQYLAPGEHMLKLVLPEETCKKGGFCEELPTQDWVPALEPLSPGKRNEMQMKAGLTCEVCLQVIQELDQWLDSNSTEALISHALERVCGVMPTSIVQQCVAMVDAYSPALVEFVTRVPPEKVCRAVRLCSSQRRLARALHEARATPLPPLLDNRDNQGSFCNGCKRLLGVSARNLERKSTKRGILQAFKGGCRILPLPYMIQCNRFVDQYEPVLIATLAEMMDPTALCARVGACHAPRAPLLGSDQCVMGPSFWCQSQEAAEMCDAVKHCQLHIWKMAPFHAAESECPQPSTC